MRIKEPGRVAALLICAFLLLGTFAPFAPDYAEPDDSFAIRITPPAAAASGEAAARGDSRHRQRRGRVQKRAGQKGQKPDVADYHI